MSTGPVSDGGLRRVRFLRHLVFPLVASAAALALVLVGWSRFGGDITTYLFSNGVLNPRTSYVLFHALAAVVYGAMLIAQRLSLGGVGRTAMVADYAPVSGRWIAFGAVSGVALVIMVLVVTSVAHANGVEFKEDPGLRAAMPHSAPELALALATVVILGPYAEELYFRGALLSWVRDKIGLFAAILIASALFALAHGQFAVSPGAQGWIMTGLLGVVGVVASILAWRSRSLWPPFATHAAFNGTMIALGFLAPQAQS